MADTAAPVALPNISLKGKKIPLPVLSVIPLETAEKFRVLPFEQTEDVLKLAIVYPDQLKQGFFLALKQIGVRIGRKVELYQTDAAGFKDAVLRYRNLLKEVGEPRPPVKIVAPPEAELAKPKPAVSQSPTPASTSASPASVWPAVPAPPLFELGKLVAYNYMKRIPFEFAKAQRVACVDFLRPNTYWFVTDGSNDAKLQTMVPLIEDANKIQVRMLVITREQLDGLLQYYGTLVKQEQLERQEQEKTELQQRKQEEEKELLRFERGETTEEQPRKVAKDVVVTDIPAEILTTEQEKRGIAGIFQKVAQNFTAQELEHKPDDTRAVSTELQQVVYEKPSATPQPKIIDSTPSAANQAGGSNQGQPSPPVPAPSARPTTAPAATQDENGDIGRLLHSQVASLDELKSHIRSGQIPRIVAAIVSYAIQEKASDIHLEVFEDELRIRYRIDGQLVDIVKLSPEVHGPVVSRIKILAKLKLDENRIPQDGRFDVNFDEKTQVDLRISVMPTSHGEKVVMRILDKSRGIASLEKLGIEGKAYEDLTQAIQKPFGICLATGPTGSGKSTSLYAVLQRIATPNVNVVTLEDPIEYEMKGVNQSQIRPKIGYTFADGLRAILRQDPNIIMVGEIRDSETANMATQAALTGHLVLSTLHTNDAAGAIPRLENMGIEPFLIASSLNMVMGQRLVRKICTNCKREVTLPEGVMSKIRSELDEIAKLNPLDAKRVKNPPTFFQGTGCAQCGGKGYQGRVGIYEVLMMSDELEDLTLKRASGVQIGELAKKQGMLTMYQDGLVKVSNGVTTLDEVLRETSNK